MVKAQIHAGGRGKAGGVKLAKSPAEAADLAKSIMGMKLVTPQGKLFSRKRSGACAFCQRRIQVAVKRARLLALLPFVGR